MVNAGKETTVYLVRHAEAQGNTLRIFQGHTDAPISDKGYQQLALLRERFHDIPLDAVYASPLERTRETAKAVNYYHNLPIHYDAGLKEINGGLFEGRRWEDLPTLFPEAYGLWENDFSRFEVEKGESMRQVYDRMRRTVDGIVQKEAGKTIAIVSHGCAIRNFLCYAQGLPLERIADVGWCDNTAVSKLVYKDGGYRVEYINDASHLPHELSTVRHQRWFNPDAE